MTYRDMDLPENFSKKFPFSIEKPLSYPGSKFIKMIKWCNEICGKDGWSVHEIQENKRDIWFFAKEEYLIWFNLRFNNCG